MTIVYDKKTVKTVNRATLFNRIDLLERYMQEKHNYSLDEIVEICNRLRHGEYLGDALAAEVYKIEGTLDNMEQWINNEIANEEETLKETVD